MACRGPAGIVVRQRIESGRKPADGERTHGFDTSQAGGKSRARIGRARAISIAQAQPYPSRPITIVVALAAGTGMDIVVRSYAEKLSQTLGRPIIIENRPGNAGLAAVDGAIKAPADGYTLLAATSSAMAIRPSMFKKPPYDPNTDSCRSRTI